MPIVVRVLVGICGAAIVIWVVDAAIRTFMFPRGSRVKLTRAVGAFVAFVCRVLAPPSSPYLRRDRVQSLRAPLTLLAYQMAWLLLVFFGFELLFLAVDDLGLVEAGHYSGSALFTLGFASPHSDVSLVLVYSEAAIGLTLLALLIAYLPTIYTAFQRRELMVAKLAVRAGSPASPWHALVIAKQTESIAWMDDTMWAEWEDWFIELAESHTSLAILNVYRSPDPNNHWISAARTVLDTAVLRVAVVDIPAAVGPRVTIRSGILTLRTLADYFQYEYPAEVSYRDPISITREQFDAACDYIASSGLPVRADRDAAWRDFAGWRVNYDAIIEHAAVVFDTPPNPWDTVTTAACSMMAS